MLARCSARKIVGSVPRLTPRVRFGRHYQHPRKFASSAKPVPASPTTTSASHSAFGNLSEDLDRIAPRFEIDADQIEILKEPQEFYDVLKTKILNAKRRIYISTLYIGKTEDELLATIRTALRTNPQLSISFLTDALRGTREAPDPSCASLLAPLIAEFGHERVRIRMFHTPNLVGVRKAVLPRRINEGWGLQHMKLYGFDDELIMSGANLSSDYFTNRQDRYHLFRSKILTDYYERIHDAVSSISFDIQPDNATQSGFAMLWPTLHTCVSPLEDPEAYIRYASALLAPLIKPSVTHTAPGIDPTAGISSNTLRKQTTVYPLFQLTPILPATASSPAPSTELPALGLILRGLSAAPFAPARWTFTAGYFNMTPFIRDLLLSSLQQTSHKVRSTSQTSVVNEPLGTVITAHPHANGFYGSKGLTGLLPAAYTLMARRFLSAVGKSGLRDRVSLHEWKRGVVGDADCWTYHAKGLWVTMPPSPQKGVVDANASDAAEQPNQGGPALTLVGSSNYTKRSHSLDLEANTLILTTDEDLKRRLREEEEHLMEYAGPKVSLEELQKPERRVGIKVRLALWITALIGGAL